MTAYEYVNGMLARNAMKELLAQADNERLAALARRRRPSRSSEILGRVGGSVASFRARFRDASPAAPMCTGCPQATPASPKA